VLLVIAADDGPMPQTREHLELLDLLGLNWGAIALTKVDTVSAERLAQAKIEIATLLGDSSFSRCPVFPLSGHTGDGVAPLRDHLAREAAHHPKRSATGRFRLAIDRCFSLPGTGTVVTGTTHAGRVDVGETAVISPSSQGKTLKARVRSLHVQDRPAQSGQAGNRCALALAGDFEKADVARGMWLVDPELAVPLTRFQGELRIPTGQKASKALSHLQPVHVHLGTSDILGRVALLDCTVVGGDSPQQTALVEILLERETLAVRGDRFILRDAGAQRTIAGGRVLDIFPPTRHKRSAERLDTLRAMRDDDPATTLTRLSSLATGGVDLVRFSINWNLNKEDAEALWSQASLRVIRTADGATGFTLTSWRALEEKLLDALAHEHARAPDMIGVERERLRRLVQGTLVRSTFDVLVTELLHRGDIARTHAWLHLPSHHASVSTSDRDLFATLKPLLDAAPYNPPRVRDVFKAAGAAEDTVRQVFRRLARIGELYPVAHDHFFTAAAVAQLARIVAELHAKHGAARAAELRDALYPNGGGGRKVAIQILEFFDRIGYTRRVRDDHLVRGESAAHHWINT
jgi:selenocysteine-specific elongation factor